MPLLERIKVFVYSTKLSTLGFVDKEGAMHACAQAGSSAFTGLKHYPGAMDERYISVEEKNAIAAVEAFCKKHGFDFEIIDFAKLGFLDKMKLKRKGVKTFPAILYGEKAFHGVPTEKDLERLVKH
ncbi:hypothetical protein DRO34_04420 [Candidatus Bathyarchaeota archaeon]|nr:MAG: hypothetical protein DRO34_04420 [Candidatus Bathyarchaeota archaeon]